MSEAARTPLFDTVRQRLFLTRAQNTGGAPQFLYQHVAQEIVERLSMVLRQFHDIVDIATPSNLPITTVADFFAKQNHLQNHQPNFTRLALCEETDKEPAIFASLTGTTEALPFTDNSFDCALSCLALQGVNDLLRALEEAHRVLKPDGLLLGCLLGRGSLQELRESFVTGEVATTGGASPRVVPFPEASDIGALLQRAKFALPVVDVETLTIRYQTLFDLLHDLRAHGASNALMQREKKSLTRASLFATAGHYAQNFSDSDGKMRATLEIIWFSAFKPHPSQQKPLPRGSAKKPLEEALREIAQNKSAPFASQPKND